MYQEKFYNQLLQCLPSLWRAAQRYTLTHEDTEDLLQDTIIVMIEQKERYKDGNLGGWGYTLLTHLYLNKSRLKNFILLCNDIPSEALYYNPCCDMSMEIEVLNSYFRETIELWIAGYEYKEIAQILHISTGTVKSRINRTRKLLRKVL